MTDFSLPLSSQPLMIALAGPNGAGKSTYYSIYLKSSGLKWVNADDMARGLGLEVYEAAQLADDTRRGLVQERSSFIFETVFSDPVGDKVEFLQEAVEAGYNVILCFIGIAGPETSEQRVSARVAEGGHDVPNDKINTRYARVLANLKQALLLLPEVRVYDNQDSRNPFRLVAKCERGTITARYPPVPDWLRPLLPKQS